MAALYAALDEQRQARGLTWAGATREINRADARPVLHPISVSSVTGTRNGRGGEGNIVLQMLLWLDRTPESFVQDHPAPSTPPPPQPPPDRRLRWDVPALHAALDEKRQERGMTWKQVADEIGGFTPRDAHRPGQGAPYRLSASDETGHMARPAGREFHRGPGTALALGANGA